MSLGVGCTAVTVDSDLHLGTVVQEDKGMLKLYNIQLGNRRLHEALPVNLRTFQKSNFKALYEHAQVRVVAKGGTGSNVLYNFAQR